MSIAKVLLLFLGLILLGFSWRQTLYAQGSHRITGTYTNMYYNTQGGDVLGEELKIVLTQGGRYQGALQFAEGEPEDLMVVDIELKGDAISFSVPEVDRHAGRFGGTIDNGVIRGQFKFKRVGIENVTLKKGKSYWD
ncbi:MAG TPA: hypothetical protein VHM88_12190 [Candidatus Acidoferrales bacterium]|jgi:hypothetical protein|nr:hypothetical protein [Candidatus Acidoferrales bacterium]